MAHKREWHKILKAQDTKKTKMPKIKSKIKFVNRLKNR